MKNNTVKLHRVLMASPEKVFKAFTDADAMAFLGCLLSNL